MSLGDSSVSMFEFTMSPSTRSLARSPAVMCRSDASRSIISSSSERRLTAAPAAGAPWAPLGAVG